MLRHHREEWNGTAKGSFEKRRNGMEVLRIHSEKESCCLGLFEKRRNDYLGFVSKKENWNEDEWKDEKWG